MNLGVPVLNALNLDIDSLGDDFYTAREEYIKGLLDCHVNPRVLSCNYPSNMTVEQASWGLQSRNTSHYIPHLYCSRE